MVNVDQHRNIHFFVDALEVAHDLMGGHRVKRGDRLVGQNDGGVLVQGAGQRHALLLAAGKLVAAGIGLVQNAHLIQRLQGLQLLLSGKNAEQNPEEVHIGHHGGKHVFDGGGAGNQVEGLKDHADFAAEAAHGLAPQGHYVHAVHRQRALGNVDHAVDGTDQRGFTGAGEADDGDKLALINGQVYILQAFDAIGIGLAHVLEFDQDIDPFFGCAVYFCKCYL